MSTQPPLPKPVYPIHETELPISKKKVKYRGFVTREHRSLLTAQESMNEQTKAGLAVDPKPLIDAICEVIESTTGINPKDIPTIETEFLILKVKAASQDSMLKFQFVDEETGDLIKLKVDLNDFDTIIPEGFSNHIRLDKDTVLEMRLPNIMDIMLLGDASTPKSDRIVTITTNCMMKLFQGDSEFDLSEYSVDDKKSYLDDLVEDQLNMIAQFFDNLPRMKREIKYKRADGTEKTLVIEGTQHFFI